MNSLKMEKCLINQDLHIMVFPHLRNVMFILNCSVYTNDFRVSFSFAWLLILILIACCI